MTPIGSDRPPSSKKTSLTPCAGSGSTGARASAWAGRTASTGNPAVTTATSKRPQTSSTRGRPTTTTACPMSSRRFAAGPRKSVCTRVITFDVPKTRVPRVRSGCRSHRTDRWSFEDLVRGEISFEARDIDDFVILRSDGTPTYHLASTVDDVDYDITHVARGEDLLPSTPKHILLTRALGAEVPEYAHLPLLFGTDGKKLSKRHGAISLSTYRDEGYLADAVFNYLSLLGWSIDGDRTVFSRDEAIAAFDLIDVSRNPAVFDPDKLAWMNGEYIRALDPGEFRTLARPHVEAAVGRPLDEEESARFDAVADLVQERTRLLPEAGQQVVFLFEDFDEYDRAAWDKVMAKDGVPGILKTASSVWPHSTPGARLTSKRCCGGCWRRWVSAPPRVSNRFVWP